MQQDTGGWIVQLIGVAAVIALAHCMSLLVRRPAQSLFQRAIDVLLFCGCFLGWVVGAAYSMALGIVNLSQLWG